MIIQFFITTEISSFILFFWRRTCWWINHGLSHRESLQKFQKKKMQRDKIVYLDLSISLVHFHNFHVSLSHSLHLKTNYRLKWDLIRAWTLARKRWNTFITMSKSEVERCWNSVQQYTMSVTSLALYWNIVDNCLDIIFLF